jgi:NitT/TauT family transport system ATP-binding protein
LGVPTLDAVAEDRGAAALLLSVSGVRQSFRNPSGGEILVLDNVDLSLREGDIVGLLGRSGSGKSTLLRIIAGLIKPTAGTVTFGGQLVAGPCKGVAMVFQSFALFPWLTQGTARPDPQAGFDGLPAGQG